MRYNGAAGEFDWPRCANTLLEVPAPFVRACRATATGPAPKQQSPLLKHSRCDANYSETKIVSPDVMPRR